MNIKQYSLYDAVRECVEFNKDIIIIDFDY